MMYFDWNRYCLFALVCFSSPRPELNQGNGMCSYYNSEDVGKVSLVLDVSKYGRDEQAVNDCLKLGPFNTIMMRTSENLVGDQSIGIYLDSFKCDHLIVLGNIHPFILDHNERKQIMRATSLIVHKNQYLDSWNRLKGIKFMYIRIDTCSLSSSEKVHLNNLVLSRYLLTLMLVKIDGINPWEDLRYELAPNLRELSIHDFKLRSLSKKHSDESFRKLKWLNFRNNLIETVEKGFFDNMPLLEVVIFEQNLLRTFSHTFIQVPKEVHLDGNPLIGDEEMCKFLSAPYVNFIGTSQICGKKSKSNTALMAV